MVAARAPALLLLLATGRLGWPNALEADARALATLPAAERPAAIRRLVDGSGVAAATPYLLPSLADKDLAVRLYAGRLLARVGEPAAIAAAAAWVTAPSNPLVERVLGLGVLALLPRLSVDARRVIEQATRDGEAGVRLGALDALDRHDLGPSLAPILRALDDDNREVRRLAIRLAARARDARTTLPLLRRLDDPDPALRLEAVGALASGGDPRAVPAMLRLAGDGPVELRIAAIDALGALKAPSATPLLTALLRRRPLEELGRHAALALGDLATPAATAALVVALRTPPIPNEALLALRRDGAPAVEALVAELERGVPSSAVAAAGLLAQSRDRRAIAPLDAAVDGALIGAGSSAIALAALDALASFTDPAAIPTLARAAEAPDAEIRRRAFRALAASRESGAVAVVEAGLADPDAGVRALAAEIAGTFGVRDAAPTLAARLADADPAVRGTAARALLHVDGAVEPIVTALLRPEGSRVGEPVLSALGDALERQAAAGDVGRLCEALAAAQGEARRPLLRGLEAALAGRPLTDGPTIDRLIALVSENDAGVATAAADVLAASEVPPRSVSRLERAFGGAEPAVRARLCATVAHLPKGASWLAGLITGRNVDPEVRAAAAWASRGLPEAGAALESAAQDDDGPVAGNARAALGAKPRGAWTKTAAARLLSPDGAPVSGRWVSFEVSGLAVQAMTDAGGVARVSGLPEAPVAVRAAGLMLARP